MPANQPYRRPTSYLSMLYQLVKIGAISKGLYSWAKNQSKQVQKQTYNKYKNVSVKANKTRSNKKKALPLAKKVKNLEKKLKTAMGLQTYKYIGSSTLRTASNQCNYANLCSFSVSEIETAISTLRYFNPSVPGTLITTDFTSGTFQKEVMISAYGSCAVRNNYQVPVVVDAYVCQVKQDTSVPPLTFLIDGLTDNGFTSPQTNILGYPTDSDVMLDNWKVKKHIKKVLKAGDMFDISYNTKKFSYDPSFYDTHTLTYQKQFDSHIILFRVQGVIGHDNTSAVQQGTLAAGIDVLLKLNVKVEYNAGADINYYVLNNGLVAMTTSAILSSPDVESITYTTA